MNYIKVQHNIMKAMAKGEPVYYQPVEWGDGSVIIYGNTWMIDIPICNLYLAEQRMKKGNMGIKLLYESDIFCPDNHIIGYNEEIKAYKMDVKDHKNRDLYLSKKILDFLDIKIEDYNVSCAFPNLCILSDKDGVIRCALMPIVKKGASNEDNQ